MGKIKLLDCTLRDGGYVNDWEFGHDNLVSIFERVVEANVDIIEVGFLDDRREFDINRSIMPNTDCVEKIYGKLNRKNAMVVGMIDYGTCSLDNISECKDSYLDGIRVIFKKHLREDAMQFCKALKDKGYKVFSQLVSVTSYSDEEMMDLIRLANEVEPYAVSMVDTYGLMHQNNLIHYFDLLNENLKPQIGIGYHGHNNFQMGYANCIAMLDKKIDREIVVDGTIYGMGKSAGNAPIELIAMHMNNSLGKDYQISQFLEAIDANITQFYKPATWGYNMFFYLAASNECHPNYVTDLMNKRTLSVKSINEILSMLEGEKKLMYDKAYMEELYLKYQDREVNDTETIKNLRDILKDKQILLVGPGSSMSDEKDKVERFVESSSPVVISINYVPSYLSPDYVFISNAKRYVQLATTLSNENYPIIATSNVTSSNGKFDYVLNISSLLDRKAKIIDNSLIMLLKAFEKMDINNVMLAGFDGYSKETANYFRNSMEYDFIKGMEDYLNEYTTNYLDSVKDKIKIEFLTESKYRGVE